MAFYDILLIYRRLSRDARWAYSFMLVHKENLNAYTMLARTEDEKNKWIEAIREAFDNEVPPQSFTSTHEPVMTTFDKPTTCSYCNKMLKGLFYQGNYFFDVTIAALTECSRLPVCQVSQGHAQGVYLAAFQVRTHWCSSLSPAPASLHASAERHPHQQTQLDPLTAGARARGRGSRVCQHKDGGACLVRGGHGPGPGQREYAALPNGDLLGQGQAPGRGEGRLCPQSQDERGGIVIDIKYHRQISITAPF